MIGVSGGLLLRDADASALHSSHLSMLGPTGRQPFVAHVGQSGPLDTCTELQIDDVHLVARLSSIGDPPDQKLKLIADALRQASLARLHAIDGDYAFAAHRSNEQRLVLGRAPLSNFPLFYHTDPNGITFGPIASALVDSSGSRPDLVMLAAQHLGTPAFAKNRTAFKGVSIVQPGTVVIADRDGVRTKRFWTPADWESEQLDDGDAADRLRESLFRAVRKIAAQSSSLASHCSSGRDSSAVTAVAATILGPSRHLLSLTAGRGSEHSDLSTQGDEAAVASAIAARYDNIDHRIWRGSGIDLAERLDHVHRVLHGPFGTPVNLGWWDGLRQMAWGDGETVILTGACGNLTISAGGPWYLGDLLRTGRLHSFMSAFRDAAGFPGASRRNLLNIALGPVLPQAIQKLASSPSIGSPFLRGALRDELERQDRAQDRRPPWSFEDARRQSLELTDMVDETNEDAGMLLVDPTIDRDVVSASLGLSLGQLASRYDRRPIYERAFADLLPADVVRSPIRAAQSADWRTQFDVPRLVCAFERYASNDSVKDLVDVAAVRAAFAAWPSATSPDPQNALLYTDRLLPAVALSSFLAMHFPN